jgi:hypothetical protein
MSKTLGELLHELPEDIRDQAIAHTKSQGGHMDATIWPTPAEALRAGFLWDRTPEGYDYWAKAYDNNGGSWADGPL